MKIIDILTSPWAIVPEKLYEIQEIYSTHLRGEKIDIAAIEAKIGKTTNDPPPKPYAIENRVAVIPMHGVMAKRMNLFTRISGGVSTELVTKALDQALGDPDVSGILLDIDSPGGVIDGVQELGDRVFDGRNQKPIAAYWVGSAADRIYISGGTVMTGSIGVVATHVDYSQYEKKLGIKTTEVYAGKYKRITSQYKPLSKEGRQNLQDMVDYLYTVFVDEIAKHRGVSSNTVLEDMADGKIFIGKQGIDASLVDGVSTRDRIINKILPVMQVEKARKAKLSILNRRIKHETGRF